MENSFDSLGFKESIFIVFHNYTQIHPRFIHIFMNPYIRRHFTCLKENRKSKNQVIFFLLLLPFYHALSCEFMYSEIMLNAFKEKEKRKTKEKQVVNVKVV